MSMVRQGGGNSGFGGDPRTITFASLTSGAFASLAAGQTLVAVVANSGAVAFTSATCGGNAMTVDNSNPGWAIYRYYSASGGETSCDFNTGSSVIVYATIYVDDEIDPADPVDVTVAWGASGEGFAVAHQFDYTAGVPAAGGVAIASGTRDDCTGTGGTTAINVVNGSVLLYKSVASAGAGSLNCDLSVAGFLDGMVVVYNYAAGGSSGIAKLAALLRRQMGN